MKETTTLAVTKQVAKKAKSKADAAGLTMFAYVDLILGYAVDNMEVRVEAEEVGDGSQEPAE